MACLTRAGLWPVVIMLTVLAGCTGGPGPTSTGTGAPAGIRSGWQEGEFTQDRDICTAVSEATVARLSLSPAGKAAEDPPSCVWTERGSRPTRRLSIVQLRYRPPAGGTAAREAKRAFQAPEGWVYRASAPVRGLGDQAMLARRFEPGLRLREVALAVRVRNVILLVKASSGTHVEERAPARVADLSGRVVPLGDLEMAVEAAARDVLPAFGVKPAPSRPAPALGEREIGRIGKICGTVDTWEHPLKGLEVTDVRAAGSERARACRWGPRRPGGSARPVQATELAIEAEVVPPSRLTGETATRATGAINYAGTTIREELTGADDGVAGAAVIEDEAESGREYTYGYFAVEGNLLVHLRYTARFDPPEPERPRWLRNESFAMIIEMMHRNPD